MPAKPNIVLVHGAWADGSSAACDGERSTVERRASAAAQPGCSGHAGYRRSEMLDQYPVLKLRGRSGECELLDRLVADVREGRSRVWVLRGEAGIGKTALLDHLAAVASGCRVVRTAGVESEMELAYAGLHQFCSSMLGGVDHLSAPQRDALSVAFGLQAGPAPDQFMVGLAVLGLLTQAAEEQPQVRLIDDAQWLDQVSAQTLAFVARRLLAERVAVDIHSSRRQRRQGSSWASRVDSPWTTGRRRPLPT